MFIKKLIAYIILFVLPLSFVIYNALSGNLGVEFSEEVLHYFGRFSIFLLTLMLLSKYIAYFQALFFIKSYRKEIGISAFLFACLHIAIYSLGVNLSDILLEILKRRYILLGFLLFGLMFLMFISSFFKKSLFIKFSSLILPFSLLGSLHYLFSGKVLSITALVIFLVIFILLCFKIVESKNNKRLES